MKAFIRLKEDLKKNRFQIIIGLIALLIVDLLQLFIPRITKFAVDDLTAGKATPNGLIIYAIQILIIAIIIGGLRYVWRYFILGSARHIEKALRERLFKHLQTLSYNYFSKTRVGEIMAHATNDIEAVRMSLAMGLVFWVDTIVLGILTIFFMIYIQPLLTLYAIIPMPFITLGTLFFSKMIHRRFEILQKAFGLLMERVRESIVGIRVVKAYVLEDSEKKKLENIGRDYIQKSVNLTKIWGMFFPLLLFLSNISTVIVLYFGGKLTILQSISMGDFVAFLSYLGMLTWPMMALGWAINIIQRGSASMERLNRIFEEKPKVYDYPYVVKIDRLRGRIEIKGLTYGKQNGEPIIKDINLNINEGERLVIVGKTGSGKTILCDLITRILEPPEGSIFLDGMEIHKIPIRTLRSSIGYVPQETFLFTGTVRENIVFGKFDAEDREVKEVAEIAQIYNEIMGFPDGMETLVGERGITLSGGQKQRIGIARTLLMNPSILILDDALSSVDIHTEEKILEGLERFFQGRTVIIVTHRIASLRKADRIVVLDNGRIVEEGSHSFLLEKGGIYSRIYWQSKIEEEIEGIDS